MRLRTSTLSSRLLLWPLTLLLSSPSLCLGQGAHRKPPDEPVTARAFEEMFPTPLLRAIAVSDMRMVESLLRTGAAPNVKDRSQYQHTPILVAAVQGNLKILRLLLGAGANVEASAEGGHTALLLAAANGDLEVVRALLKAGADASAATDGGVTALMYAADDAGLVKALAEAGAELEAEDKRGWTPVCWAKQGKRMKKLAALIVKGAIPEPACPGGALSK